MNKDLNNKDYNSYVERKSPKSKLGLNMLLAFVVGGLICVAAEGVSDALKACDLNEENIKTYVPIIMIFIAALLTSVGVYDKIALAAGAGTLVPITGFANAITSSAMEYKSEGVVVGIGAKMFSIVGPVILFGTLASCIAGIYYYIVSLI